MILKENERIDDLEYNDLKIIQDKSGFCFGIDSILISDFAKDIKSRSCGVDLGTGTGIISILLAEKIKYKKYNRNRDQEEVADMAKRSVKLNNLQDKVQIVNANIKDITEGKENKFIKKRKFRLRYNQSRHIKSWRQEKLIMKKKS